MWSKGNEGFVLNKPATEQLRFQYNPNNIPIEILFLDTFTLNEVRITSAGTNDGRLLFWSGSGFEYMEFAVGQRYVLMLPIAGKGIQGKANVNGLWTVSSCARLERTKDYFRSVSTGFTDFGNHCAQRSGCRGKAHSTLALAGVPREIRVHRVPQRRSERLQLAGGTESRRHFPSQRSD